MAGEWLKFECSLPEKPETLAITIAMGWDDPDTTVGKLMRLFRWFDQQTLDGNAASVTPALLDRIIGVSGFVQAVANVGWIVIGEGFVSLHNFDRHNGATAKGRALGAKRVAKHKSNAGANAVGNGGSVSDALPREEKRREELIQDPNGSSSASPPSSPQAAFAEMPTGDDPKLDDPRVPSCPYDRLLDLYAELLPTLPQPRRSLFKEGKGAIAMRQRWAWVLTGKTETGERAGLRMATSSDEGVEWFRQFFAYVAESDFLLGNSGNRSWAADIGWLMTLGNFTKVLSGNYHSEQGETAHA